MISLWLWCKTLTLLRLPDLLLLIFTALIPPHECEAGFSVCLPGYTILLPWSGHQNSVTSIFYLSLPYSEQMGFHLMIGLFNCCSAGSWHLLPATARKEPQPSSGYVSYPGPVSFESKSYVRVWNVCFPQLRAQTLQPCSTWHARRIYQWARVLVSH